MSGSKGFWHLLDPRRGDDATQPGRALRLNLRRVELAAIAMVFDAAAEGIFSIFRNSPGLGFFAIGAICGAVAFMAVARHGQTQEVPGPLHLPEAFVVYVLICSQAAGYFIALGGRITSGYAMVYLAAAAFFLIPPRRFALIGIGTFALFLVWVFVLLDAPLFEKVVAAFNTGLGVIAGIFGRFALDRIQQVDRQQRARIAEQNKALVEANRLLAKRNAELNDLMAIAAHDLRSPLFGLGNLLDLAATIPPSSPTPFSGLFREARDTVTTMLALIGRLLEAHEVEGRTAGTLGRGDLQRLLAQAARRMDAMARGYGIALVVVEPSRPVQAPVDPEALDQILDNLISNAIRFSPAGSRVCLSAGMAATPFIDVIDEGIGVPPEGRDRLFRKFGRGSSHPINGPRGSGLGLYIVRILAQAMAAEVSYRPGDTGGSVFRVAFQADGIPARSASKTRSAESRIRSD